MIIISKSEREKVLEQYPHVCIVRAKHHYYCEEDPRVMRLLGRATSYTPRKRNNKKNNANNWKRSNNER